MNFSVNNFGFLPLNSDSLLDATSFGQGTERPVGLTFSQIFKLYWTVKSFVVNASIQIPQNAMDVFLSAGGASGDLNSALGGLILVGESSKQGKQNFTAQTIISSIYKQKVRKGNKTVLGKANLAIQNLYTWDGIKNNELTSNIRRQTTPELNAASSSGYSSIIDVKNSHPNEGTLLSPGPIHSATSDSGLVVIDLSSVIFRQGLYWPIVKINVGSASSILTERSSLTIGGITFLGSNINIYIDLSNLSYPVTVFSLGSIEIGRRIRDRFYFDNADKLRSQLPDY